MDNSSRFRLAQAYLQTFTKSSNGLSVLDDLHRLFDDMNTFDPDPYRNAFNSGKREVVRHIQRQLAIAQVEPQQEESEE